MCTEGMVCKGEMNIVIRIHTGNNSKSERTTNRIHENISKVIYVTVPLSVQDCPGKRENRHSINSVERQESTLTEYWRTFGAALNQNQVRPASDIMIW